MNVSVNESEMSIRESIYESLSENMSDRVIVRADMYICVPVVCTN